MVSEGRQDRDLRVSRRIRRSGSGYLNLPNHETALLRYGLAIFTDGREVGLDGLSNALHRFFYSLALRVTARDRRHIDPESPLLGRMDDNRPEKYRRHSPLRAMHFLAPTA
jgi:hypothetical protein